MHRHTKKKIKKNQAHKEGGLPLQEETPTIHDFAGRIITKNLRYRSPLENIKANKRPSGHP